MTMLVFSHGDTHISQRCVFHIIAITNIAKAIWNSAYSAIPILYSYFQMLFAIGLSWKMLTTKIINMPKICVTFIIAKRNYVSNMARLSPFP